METPLTEAIEAMIDRQTLATLLGEVANVCRMKGAHIAENWQDRGLAAEWDGMAKRLEDAQFMARSQGL